METRIYSFEMLDLINQFNNNINTKNIWDDKYPPKDFLR